MTVDVLKHIAAVLAIMVMIGVVIDPVKAAATVGHAVHVLRVTAAGGTP
jgi:uncharacterized membrane protein